MLALLTVSEAYAEAVKGQSRDLGIQFEVLGGENWCSPEITVALTAATPDVLEQEALPFVQMLGRIRAIVMHQCPSIERIAFDGVSQQRTVLSIEMTRLTRWRRLVRVDPGTRRPPCPAREPAASECSKRVDAYVLTHSLLRGDRSAQAELTTILDETEAAQAVWVSGAVTGKLTIKEQADFGGRYTSSGQLADAIMHGIGSQCGSDGALAEQAWSQTWSKGSAGEVAARGLSCRPAAGAPSHHAVVVTSVGARLHIFALLSTGDHAQAAKAEATILALAIGEPR